MTPEKIASFRINHDTLTPGIYVSRVDGDITTYDLRTRVPNSGDYMDNLTMHSVEHMLATYLRSGSLADSIIYFGPMGCQTGFYLLVRDADNAAVLSAVCEALSLTVTHEGEIFGKVRRECGNFENLDIEAARRECKRYLAVLSGRENNFKYEE